MLKRRRVWIMLALWFSVSDIAIAQSTEPVAEIEGLRLFSDFWLNLHHFLYVSAWARRADTPAQRRRAMPLPADDGVAMTDAERATWDTAVLYYDHELASKDLLFDGSLTAINNSLAGVRTLSGLSLAADHRRFLETAAPIYRRYWWPQHDAANRAWIADVAQRTTPVAAQIIDRLTTLYGIKWFDAPIRVDVVRVGKSQGAYTAVVPRVHIIVASADASYAGWAGAEMLFHESSHGLIQNVQAAVDKAMTAVGKNPRDLWHVVLFYITGEVTRQTLSARRIEYQPYLYATGLFTRAWPTFREPIEQTVRPFVDRQISLAEMARKLAASVP
ncbi:MAG TPA: hypothetical protein VKB88_11410 [Bryobacteraceae bacterium]|nr:hypothetical protein [Bryobacteraceae bacterium]